MKRRVLALLGALLLSGCWAQVTPPLPDLTPAGSPDVNALAVTVAEVQTDDPLREAVLRQTFQQFLGTSAHLQDLSLRPNPPPHVTLKLRLSHQDSGSESTWNGLKIAVNALSFFLLSPALPLHYHREADARLDLFWPSPHHETLSAHCLADGEATIDRTHGVLEQTNQALESACLERLMQQLPEALQRHPRPSAPADLGSSMEHPLTQNRFLEPLSAEQRRSAAAHLCEVLGFTQEGPERQRCLADWAEALQGD